MSGRRLSEPQRGQFHKYLKILVDWNRVHRLVGSSDPRFIVERLILDSLLFLRVLPSRSGAIVDVGSGAGLPGVPLKIAEPALQLTMLEAQRRRASFLAAAIREIPLEGARVVNSRAEDARTELGGAFDVAVLRAVSDPDRIVPIAAGLVKPGGLVVVSGPPNPGPTAVGRWVAVEGLRRSEVRHFLVHEVEEI